MFNFVDLFILAIATWRVSRVLTFDAGPGGLFVKMRWWFPMWGLWKCIYCTSAWVALFLIVIFYWSALFHPHLWGKWFVFWLGVWGLALMLRSYTGVDHDHTP